MATTASRFIDTGLNDLKPEGNQTQVTWGFESELGLNPMSRWMGLMMDNWVGGDYERGLVNLKTLVEQQA